MSENQEHKTWIMLKRALKIKSFDVGNGTIVAKFASLTRSATNEYGTWTCNDEPYENNAYAVFDQSSSTAARVKNGRKIYLYFPDGISIAINRCSVIGGHTASTLYGYNEDTKVWDNLGAGGSNKVVNNGVFYRKIYITGYSTHSSYSYGNIESFSIHSGQIKYDN